MENAAFGNKIPVKDMKTVSQNGQIDARMLEAQQQQNGSIFGAKSSSANVNQSNTNSSGTGGLDNIFAGGGMAIPAGGDNTSIFNGLNKGSQYALYSKKDYNYDVPKLTQESIANQKAAEGPKRTNPKAFNVDMTPKENPYAAFRNADMQEPSLGETIGNAFAILFGQKKAD